MKLEPIKRLFGRRSTDASGTSSQPGEKLAATRSTSTPAASGRDKPDTPLSARSASIPPVRRNGSISGGAPAPKAKDIQKATKAETVTLDTSLGFVSSTAALEAEKVDTDDLSPSNATGRFPHQRVQKNGISSNLWAMAYVVVRFDLEAGQVVEKVFPEDALNAAQRKEICLMSFPDSNSHITIDTCYVIKPKRRGGKRYDYGYVYFRQKKDPSLPRGYLQQSLVLLSRYPFASLMEQVLKRIAGVYYSMCPVSPTPYVNSAMSTSTALVGNVTFSSKVEVGGGGGGGGGNGGGDGGRGSPVFYQRAVSVDSAGCDFTAERTSTEGAMVAGAVLICASALDGALHKLPERYQLLVDSLLEMATWSYPESCGEFSFPFMGGQVRWSAPKFRITSRTTTINFSKRDVLHPSHRISTGAANLERRNDQFRSPTAFSMGQRHQRRGSDVSPLSSGSPTTTPAVAPQSSPSAKLDDSKVDSSLIDRISGMRYVLGEMPLYSTFRSLLKRLWRLWELSLLGEPICIISKTPTVSASAVLAVVSLIHPISSCADARPYFSVQDPDFKHISKTPPDSFGGKGPIIGATNPYFLKVLKQWPHLLVLDDHQTLEYCSVPNVDSEADELSPPPSPQGKEKEKEKEGGPAGLLKEQKQSLALGLKNLVAAKSIRERLLSEYQEVFVSDRSYVVNDSAEVVKAVVAQLVAGDNAMTDQVNSDVLRAHFLHLTDNFLKPLVNCFKLLWDTDTTCFALKKQQYKTRYTKSYFKDHVRANGYVKKIFRRDSKRVIVLYERFIGGCHFDNWLEEKVIDRWKAEFQQCDAATFSAGLGEAQRIEVFMLLCQELANEEMQLLRDTSHITLLLRHIDALLQGLPVPMRKPLLRSHYKTAWGNDAALPPWAIESEDESPAFDKLKDEGEGVADEAEGGEEGEGEDTTDLDSPRGSEAVLESWRMRVVAGGASSLTPPPHDTGVVSPVMSVSPTPSHSRDFPGPTYTTPKELE